MACKILIDGLVCGFISGWRFNMFSCYLVGAYRCLRLKQIVKTKNARLYLSAKAISEGRLV